MKARFLTDAAASKAVLDLALRCDSFSFAVAWAGQNVISSAFLRHSKKVQFGVVGTHLYHTSPELLRNYIDSPSVRWKTPNGRLFHPKVYVFRFGGSISAIIGSHNLTAGAFQDRNIEASVLLTGTARTRSLSDLMDFVSKSWEEAIRIEDNDVLLSYELQHKANQKSIARLEQFQVARKPRQNSYESLLTLTWQSFVDRVRKDKHHSESGRLAILASARQLFEEHHSFIKMHEHQRRAIAGTYGRKEMQLDGHDWGWFGSMFGQGDFKNLVKEAPAELSNALNCIPLTGDVQQSEYDEFVKHFRQAFAGKAHKGGVATASRLLAMKRPDIFVAVNKANRERLCGGFGVAPTTLKLTNYWPAIIAPIMMSKWWNHPRPGSGIAGRIWDYRAAMLDSIFYVPI